MFIGFSILFSRSFLMRKAKGSWRFPKGLAPTDTKTRQLFDLSRKRRQGHRPTASTKERLINGDYGTAGQFMYKLLESTSESVDYAKLANLFGTVGGDFTLSAEYEQALKTADDDLLRIARDEPSIKSSQRQIPKPIVQALQSCKQSNGIRQDFICRCYLFSLALFDANPLIMGTKPFSEIFGQPKDSCQKALTSIRLDRIKKSGITIEDFVQKMYPPERRYEDPKKVFEAQLRDPARIIQPQFITRFAETYYDNCMDEMHKQDVLKEYISCLWNFVIQSAVCMDKMKEEIKFDFQAEAKKHYTEFLKCADLYYVDFSRNA